MQSLSIQLRQMETGPSLVGHSTILASLVSRGERNVRCTAVDREVWYSALLKDVI